ncbi:flagellar biosynthetic protein FliO [Microbulbifer elongatus]|uniref:Flagellar protein n=1 Tax=Microbulbifer elongatus TaxID=86173 RepID=A0ABT1NWT5_9GAMM|nr:flagellar biosynthetic protein FliO [Microbulbifer elongatus]MCQ3828358.1 flagellar biosynthetic protein FliO [Microbulbifer elongatus]
MNGASTSGGESVIGLAVLGKVAGVLIALVAFILLCAWLTRRLAPGLSHNRIGPQMDIVASKTLGTREKVVVLQVEDQWLVLGVGGGQISCLHSLAAAPIDTPAAIPSSDLNEVDSGSFPERFARALGQNLRSKGKGS